MKKNSFPVIELTKLLDREFEIEKNPENLLEFAITDLIITKKRRKAPEFMATKRVALCAI